MADTPKRVTELAIAVGVPLLPHLIQTVLKVGRGRRRDEVSGTRNSTASKEVRLRHVS